MTDRADVWSGAVLLAVAVAYGTAAFRLPPGGGEPGPGFLPSVFAVLLAALSIGILVGGLRRSAPSARGSSEAEATLPTESTVEPAAQRSARSWMAFLATVAYAVLFAPLGFVLSTAAFSTVVTALFTRERRWLLAVPALVTIALFVFFRVALQVRLPMGPFG